MPTPRTRLNPRQGVIWRVFDVVGVGFSTGLLDVLSVGPCIILFRSFGLCFLILAVYLVS